MDAAVVKDKIHAGKLLPGLLGLQIKFHNSLVTYKTNKTVTGPCRHQQKKIMRIVLRLHALYKWNTAAVSVMGVYIPVVAHLFQTPFFSDNCW